MTPKPNIKHPVPKVSPKDDNWVEEEGQKLTDEEFQEQLKKMRVGDPRSKTLEEVAAELGINLDEIDVED
jgi:hypothetical protein